MAKRRKNHIIPLGILILVIIIAYLTITSLALNTTKTSGTYNTLLQQNKDQQCTWEEKLEDGTKIQGTIYLSGNKFSVEQITTNPSMIDGPRKVYLIGDGTNIYQWTDLFAETPGMKSDYSLLKDTDQSIYPIDFSCKKWTPQNEKYHIPQNIQFRDLKQEASQKNQEKL